jgi:hypothetical protein
MPLTNAEKKRRQAEKKTKPRPQRTFTGKIIIVIGVVAVIMGFLLGGMAFPGSLIYSMHLFGLDDMSLAASLCGGAKVFLICAPLSAIFLLLGGVILNTFGPSIK